MDSLIIPLKVTEKGFAIEKNLKRSIDAMIELLLTTPQFSMPADSGFGFVFNNLRFEIFNEQEGVVFDSNDKGSVYGLPGLYNKKISGSSNNLNTYATELKNVIEKYENRLKDITVSMNYVRKERQVDVNVKGVIVSTGKEYVYTNKLKIWN